MREIKFRAWNTLCNEMWDCDKLVLSGLYLATSGDGIINVDDDRNKQHHIIPLQYTGLKDKNGIEIYEGDICQRILPNGNKGLIILIEDIREVWMTNNICDDEFEIIGNTYQNLKLLK
jgi:uncharacterized phage protein (TIGR01671 family)